MQFHNHVHFHLNDLGLPRHLLVSRRHSVGGLGIDHVSAAVDRSCRVVSDHVHPTAPAILDGVLCCRLLIQQQIFVAAGVALHETRKYCTTDLVMKMVRWW